MAVDNRGVRICDYRDGLEDSIDQEMKEELEMDFEDLLAD